MPHRFGQRRGVVHQQTRRPHASLEPTQPQPASRPRDERRAVALPRRSCLDCTRPAQPGAARCTQHGGSNTARRRSAPGNAAHTRLRRATDRAGAARCAHCHTMHRAADIVIDHRLALRDGGTDTDDNVQPLCAPCHRAKTRAETAHRTFG